MKTSVTRTLLLSVVAVVLCQATRRSIAQSCVTVMTARDAERCVGMAPVRTSSSLSPGHTYTLPELVDLAESSSPEGRIAWAHAKASMEQTGVVRAAYLPLLAFAAQASDLRTIVPFPKPIAPRGYVTVEQPLVNAQLELEYTLVDFARGPRLEAARAVQLASALRLGRTQQQIAYNVSNLYYREQLEAGRLVAARTILGTAETLVQNAQAQYDNGRSTLPDLQNAQAGVAEARFSLASAEGAVKTAKLALTEAIGVEPTTEIELPPQAAPVTPEAVVPAVESLIQAAWRSRPDLLARAEELKHARSATAVAHAAYRPTVRLASTAGQTATWPTADYGALGYANVSTWSAALALKWELFNAARRHEVAEAQADERGTAEAQRAAQDRVTREVWQAYVDYQTAVERQRAAQSYLDSSQTSYDSSLDAFRYGVRSLVDVVQAERQLAQARLAIVDANAKFTLSTVALAFAIGAQP